MSKSKKTLSFALAFMMALTPVSTNVADAAQKKVSVAQLNAAKAAVAKAEALARTVRSDADINNFVAAYRAAQTAVNKLPAGKDKTALLARLKEANFKFVEVRNNYLAAKNLAAEANKAAEEAKKAAEDTKKALEEAAKLHVVEVKAVNNTTVKVTFDKVVEKLNKADFAFDNGLEVKEVAFAQGDSKSVVITTSAQDGTKEYKLTYKGTATLSFKGVSAVVPTSIKFETVTRQAKFGEVVEVKANIGVKAAGVEVTFNIDASEDSLNQDLVGTAYTDENGIATFRYTRNYAGADFVQAYPTGNSTVRAYSKIYWGKDAILTIAPVDGTSAVNGGAKTFKVTLKDPVTGQGMRNKPVHIMFKENIENPNGTKAIATSSQRVVWNNGQWIYTINNEGVTPYQYGAFNQTLVVYTNANGEAYFTVTGVNTKVTPIAFYDFYRFFDGTNLDNTQINTRFAGNGNNRLDETELQAVADTVAFNKSVYTFEIKKGAEEAQAASKIGFTDGRKYEVVVKRSDNINVAGHKVYVGIYENLDNNAFTRSNAKFVMRDSNGNIVGLVDKLEFTLKSDGKITFEVASDTLNDTATPVVWVDQETPVVVNNQVISYNQNGIFEEGIDDYIKLGRTIFVDQLISNFVFNGPVENDVTVYNNQAAEFVYTVQDQNARAFVRNGVARVTYTITNTGSKNLRVKLGYGFDTNKPISVNGLEQSSYNPVIINPGRTITYAATTTQGATSFKLLVENAEYDGTSATNTSGARVVVSASGYLLSVDNNALAPDAYIYLPLLTAKEVVFNVAPVQPVQLAIEAGEYYIGTTADKVATDGTLKLNLPANRYITFDVDNLATTTAAKLYVGKVTYINENANLNDFSQATYISTLPGNNNETLKLLYNVLGKGAAVKVKFVDENNTKKIAEIYVLYTDSMFDANRLPQP